MKQCIENTFPHSLDTVKQVNTSANIVTQHPCFSNEAHYQVGRIHLPIAPKCNIQCNFCERNMCATEAMQHPGWTAKLLPIGEAVNLVRRIMLTRQGSNFVIGVAGPGDPLANDQTFEALGIIHQQYPQTLKCICTNGLLLEDRLNEIAAVGIRAITVTVNATSAEVGEYTYSWVRYEGVTYHGKEAASLLISKQFSGIEKAVDAGFSLKVNTVLIPGINNKEMSLIARKAKQIGASVMNIMPLIPCGKMKELRAPTCEELREARQDCEAIIPQFRRCEQCRADVIYLP